MSTKHFGRRQRWNQRLNVQVSDLILHLLDRLAEPQGLDRSSLTRTFICRYLDKPDASFERANKVLQRLHEEAAARRMGNPQPMRGPPAQWLARLTVMVNEDMLERLDERASRQGVTRSALVRSILIDRLAEQGVIPTPGEPGSLGPE